jgi:hypothetical protein
VEIIEERGDWEKKFIAWAKEAVPVIEGGETKKAFATYPFVVNGASPFAPFRSALKDARLALISSSGAFVVKNQEPFDSGNPLGDPSFRPVPVGTDINEISFRHEQYGKEFATSDPNVVFPLWILRDLEREGRIGELFSPVLSFSGYIPNAAYFIDTTGVEMLHILSRGEVDCALLVLV